nr:TPA_asm: m108.5 sORF [Murid betaherpesvirus 1]DBA08072.1 TPA_asm: m108.5 sORF [Murid betaherpesvirus 1]
MLPRWNMFMTFSGPSSEVMSRDMHPWAADPDDEPLSGDCMMVAHSQPGPQFSVRPSPFVQSKTRALS